MLHKKFVMTDFSNYEISWHDFRTHQKLFFDTKNSLFFYFGYTLKRTFKSLSRHKRTFPRKPF